MKTLHLSLLASSFLLPLAAQTPAPPIIPAPSPDQPPQTAAQPAPPIVPAPSPDQQFQAVTQPVPAAPATPPRQGPGALNQQAESIVNLDAFALERRLRAMARIEKPTLNSLDLEPRDKNHFPYYRTLAYQAWGLDVTASLLSNTGIRISMQLPYQARTEKNWAILAKALGLPAELHAPAPLAAAGRNDDVQIVSGPGLNWVAVINHNNNTAEILVGSREIFETSKDLIEDNPKTEFVSKALDEFSYTLLRSKI